MSHSNTISESTVVTLHGVSYLKRLCRHFSHKVPVSVTDSQGRIELPFGACRIDVDATHMHLRLEVTDPADVGRAEEVIATHLVRMANRDKPVVEWHRKFDDVKEAK